MSTTLDFSFFTCVYFVYFYFRYQEKQIEQVIIKRKRKHVINLVC